MKADPKLLFIISQPRSGSTLLQSIVSNNRFVATASEPWLLLPFLGFYQPGVTKARYNYDWMVWSVNEFVKKNVGEDKFRSKLKEFLLSVYSTLGKEETQYVLDKTPRYYAIVSVIEEFFPEAKFIVLKRNPFAVVRSIITTWKIDSLDKLRLYKDDLMSAPFLIQEFLDKHNSGGNLLEVHYEKLVEDSLGSFKEIYDWLGVPFSEEVLDYSANQEFKGSLGDQTGIKRHKMPVRGNPDSWKTLLKQPFWGNWLRGYSAYLGKEWLREYGGYESLFDSITDEFRYFLFVCSRDDERRYSPADEMKALMRYYYYISRYGKPTKEWHVEVTNN